MGFREVAGVHIIQNKVEKKIEKETDVALHKDT